LITSEATYHEIILFAFSRLGFTDMKAAQEMTMVEYEIRTEAYHLRNIEKRGDMALQAWLNQQVQAQKGSAKHPEPYYKELEDMYDVKAESQNLRAQFEPDFKVTYKSKAEQHRQQGEVLAQRMAEFEALKKAGKIKPAGEK